MDRATRKANLRKLQLPGSGSKIQQRKTRQSATATGTSSEISNHFLIQDKSLIEQEHKQDKPTSTTKPLAREDNNLPDTETKSTPSKPRTSRAKRTKLDAFVLKTPQAIATEELKTVSKPTNDDDFDIPEKKTKKAPPICKNDNAQAKAKKPPRRKKQTTIKSAFLRNEQLFAEIAAQHCAADNFDGDDIQLAIAISKSEAESKGIDVINENDLVADGVEVVDDGQKAEQIRQKLEKYGFRTAEQKDYSTFAAAFMPQTKIRRPKTKWANKFTALTLRDDQLQHKKLQQNIETFLNRQFRTKPLTLAEQNLPQFVLQSGLLRKCSKEMKGKIINVPENHQISNELYFVTELFEISKLPPGHLLKDWSAIQGRDLTPKKSTRKNDMETKLQGIYADLEEYFKNLKARGVLNDSVLNEVQLSGQAYENDATIVDAQDVIKSAAIVKHQETDSIFPNHLVTTGYNNHDNKQVDNIPDKLNEDSISTTDASVTSSMCNKIRNLIPPMKDLDRMQVSSSSLNTECNNELLPQVSGLDCTNISGITLKEDAVNKFAQSNSNNLDPTFGVSISLTTEATSSSKAPARDSNLLEFSDYSLGMEHLQEYNKASQQDFDTSHELQNVKSSETPFGTAQKDNIFELDLNEVKTMSVNTEATLKNRSNSPDLFADSDVEMEDIAVVSKGTTSAASINAKKSDSSLNGLEGSLTTYEIYSSDEVKNSSSLVKPNLLPKLYQINETNVIDLTQTDESETTRNRLNQSKSIVEVDLFADSPLQDEDNDVIDINSNSQKSKYLKCDEDETFRFTLSPHTTTDELSPTKDTKPQSFTMSLEDQVINEIVVDDDDDDDVVLHEIEINQTNASFLNFQGSKQLETCFHRETANEPKIMHNETKIIETLPGNNTIFQELYNKYLGDNATENDSSPRAKENVRRKSLTQTIPRAITPKRVEYGTQFTMDFNTTFEHNVTNNRKSLSFVSKTPEKCRDLSSSCKHSKSQSFTEQNISIDLTQNEEDTEQVDDDDDDCLMLSDDEINYSIWNANKTGRLEADEMEQNTDNAERKNRTKYAPPNNSSLLYTLNKDISPRTRCLFSQQSYSDFDAECFKPKETHSCSSLVKKSNKDVCLLQQTYSKSEEHNFQHDCSDFGILEEFSEPIDFTSNMCTPTKALENVSFLGSPTEHSAPMKRFSSCRKSVHQLSDLVNHLDIEPPKLDDYDEFDIQIDHNQSSRSNLPQDFDQLLTAEISFENACRKSPNKKQKSLIDFDNMKDIYKPSAHTSLQQKTKSAYHFGSETQELTIKNKTYRIRNIDSTKPDFTLYSEAELLKELYNFGIKPLKRKQAVKMLEYIYIQTHPIIEDDLIAEKSEQDYEILDDVGTAQTTTTQIRGPLSPKGSVELTSQNYLDTQSCIDDSKDRGGNKKCNLQDANGMEMLRYSLDLKSELIDEQYILQTNVTKKTPQPLMPLHIAWFNLMCSNPNLHENVLMYEPIDLQEIYLFLKGLGYRYDPKDLKQFFDSRCIIFRYDLAAAGGKVNGNNRHVRKKKNVNRKKVGP